MKRIVYIVIIFISIVCVAQAAYAESQASGENYLLWNWIQNNGAGESPQSEEAYRIHQSSIGIPTIGIIKSQPRLINNVPTYDNILWTGFLFVTWYEDFNVDDSYDIDVIDAYSFEGGTPIEEATWTNDPDPYFTWQIKRIGLEVEGFSYAYDELPDRFIDSVDPEYQTPDFSLSEGRHGFYIVAKSTGNTWGNVGLFEIWVDTQEPTISEILPGDTGVINTSTPLLQATVMDNLSGIDPDEIELTVTTELGPASVLPAYDSETGVVSYQPAEGFSDGLITVYLSVKDHAGNQSVPLFWTFTVDTESPTGSVSINNNAAATDTNIVTLQIAATEMETEIDGMMISNNSSFDGAIWEAFAAEKANWVLDPIAGVKTVYVKFRDVAGNESEVVSDAIVLTITSPNTFIIDAPPTITQMTSAAFAFSATDPGAQFYYKLDNDEWIGPTADSSITFEDIGVGNHYFQVKAGFDVDSDGFIDPDEIDLTPAVVSWSVGTLNPTTVYAERPIKYYRRE